jgi:hypothetical protein
MARFADDQAAPVRNSEDAPVGAERHDQHRAGMSGLEDDFRTGDGGRGNDQIPWAASDRIGSEPVPFFNGLLGFRGAFAVVELAIGSASSQELADTRTAAAVACPFLTMNADNCWFSIMPATGITTGLAASDKTGFGEVAEWSNAPVC